MTVSEVRVLEPKVVLTARENAGDPSESLHIGLIQTRHQDLLTSTLDRAGGISSIRAHEDLCLEGISKCVETGASLVIMPEYAGSPALWRKVRRLVAAKPVVVVAGTAKLTRLADLKGLGTWIGGDRPTRDRIGRNLGIIIFGGSCEVTYFEKVSLASAERGKLKSGTAVTVLNLKYGRFRKNLRVGIIVCHDLMDLSVLDACYRTGIQLLVVPSLNPSPQRFEERREMLCKDYQGVVVLVNAAKKSRKWGRTQLWAFEQTASNSPPNPANAAETSGLGPGREPPPAAVGEAIVVPYLIRSLDRVGCLGFVMFPESVLRKVEHAYPFMPLVNRSTVWTLNLATRSHAGGDAT
jgi:predicted amidohydrolase